MLDAGCEIESKDGNLRTPVHWAVQDSGKMLVTLTTLYLMCLINVL